jgi:hypothetical protein
MPPIESQIVPINFSSPRVLVKRSTEMRDHAGLTSILSDPMTPTTPTYPSVTPTMTSGGGFHLHPMIIIPATIFIIALVGVSIYCIRHRRIAARARGDRVPNRERASSVEGSGREPSSMVPGYMLVEQHSPILKEEQSRNEDSPEITTSLLPPLSAFQDIEASPRMTGLESPPRDLYGQDEGRLQQNG